MKQIDQGLALARLRIMQEVMRQFESLIRSLIRYVSHLNFFVFFLFILLKNIGMNISLAKGSRHISLRCSNFDIYQHAHYIV